jgi:hypothetical protein
MPSARPQVRGPDRAAACRRLHTALGQWQTVGLPTNVAFLRRVLETPQFAAGEVHTNFIPQHSAALFPTAAPPRTPLMVLAAACWMQSVQTLPAGADTAGGDGEGHFPSPFATLAFQQVGPSVSGGGGGKEGTPLLLQAVDEEGNAAGGGMRLHIWREAGTAAGRVFGWRVKASRDEATSPAGAASAVAGGTLQGATGGGGEWTDQAGVLSLGEAPVTGRGGDFRAVIGNESVRGSVFLKASGPADGPDTPVEATLLPALHLRPGALSSDRPCALACRPTTTPSAAPPRTLEPRTSNLEPRTSNLKARPSTPNLR